jgi:hypothetical protein
MRSHDAPSPRRNPGRTKRGPSGSVGWTLTALAALVATVNCHQVPLTAPPGSVISVTANPTNVPAHGGTSVVSALVMEPTGTVVPDGTVVQFLTTIGTIESQGKTNDGVARVRFTSDSRSGSAEITACSGSATGGTTTAPTPTPSSSSISAGSLAATATGTGCGTYTLQVGIITVKRLVVTANPPRIPPGGARMAEIVANAFDADGNPVASVPVIFTLQELNPSTGAPIDSSPSPAKFETMGSNGSPVFTDHNGQSYDTLFTSYSGSGSPRLVGVTATVTVSGVTAASVPVQIN